MVDKKYPKSSNRSIAEMREPAYVSWDGDEEQMNRAFSSYSQALEEASYSVANRTRSFNDLTSYAGGRSSFNSNDFDWFRPGQAAPVKPKDIIAFARYAYRRIGLIHNAIDLMGDFSCQGVRLVHPNKRIERFYNDWFHNVEGKRVSERLGHLLFREANVPIRWYTAKVYEPKRKEMQKSIGAVDLKIDHQNTYYTKKEIPWRYNFLDPILVEPIGGAMSSLINKKILSLKIPNKLRNDIRNLQNQNSEEAQKVLSEISPDILRAVRTGKDLILPPDKTAIYHYKKDDWQVWADPMTYSAFEALNLYQRLQLADKAALDGATNKIRVWKIGSLEHKLAPSPSASSTLADMLGANVGGGTIDIVWGPDIDLIETDSDVLKGLGEEKYKPTLMAIYANLGIPPTLTGTFGASGTTNNFIALKTLVERLNYVRGIILEFWNEQIKIVQKAMGFRYPAQVEFDMMYLEDPAAMATLLLNMSDRNIVSEEFVQRHIKAVPGIEHNRIKNERNVRDKDGREKISPYHAVDQEHDLKKIALQRGLVTPSEIGLELDERKSGEKSLVEIQEDNKKQQMEQRQAPNKSPDGGRPKNTKDTKPRKPKEFKPKTKAAAKMWASVAQEKISEMINPILLKSYSKSSLRNLNSKQFEALEQVKFELLCNLDIGCEINEANIKKAYANVDSTIHEEFDTWLKDAEDSLGKLTIDQVRDLRASYFVYYKYER